MHSMLPYYILAVIIAYLIGSIPFGLVVTHMAGLGDIRKVGSGNIGATNVLRTGKKWLAFITLWLDYGKGAAAVLLAAHFLPAAAPLAGLAALFGHMFPVWLKFKGGKGVATAVGVITALAWPVGVVTMVIWTVAVGVTRYSSIGALLAIGLIPANAYLFGHKELIPLSLIIICFIAGKHENNIKRLIKGTEPRISKI